MAEAQPIGLLRHPGRVIVMGLAMAVSVGTLLLSLPIATAAGTRAAFDDALFTATSAVCVTGLATVDTGAYWSVFGEVTILALIQVGGLGIMTVATLIVMLLSRRLGLRARSVVQAETRTLSAADLRRVVRTVVIFSFAVEAVVALVLTGRLVVGHDYRLSDAAYAGVFHAISAFNNAGFSPYSDNLTRFVTDGWVSITIALAVIVGGLGFPVWFELVRSWRTPRTWSILTRITVVMTVVLIVLGTVLMLSTEASNPATLGRLDDSEKLLAAFFAAVMTRTAGFNSIDMTALRPETLVVSDIWMFIGGGSAGTAGGIKVTTFGLLAAVMWSEMRAEPDVHVGRRRVPAANQRQALSVVLLSLALVATSTFILLILTPFDFADVLFETISAFATVGLSTGITPELPPPAHAVLVVLMFVGRIGPLTVASAMAVRERPRLYQLPEERTIVG